MNNTNNLEKLYRAREMASNANEHTEGYLHALDDLENIFRDTETLSDCELVDHIWDWLCERQDGLRK
jgi:hypothetical protein